MAKVCPQRIIKEAVRLLTFVEVPGEELENLSNNILELEGLEKSLYRDGIINIEEYNPNGREDKMATEDEVELACLRQEYLNALHQVQTAVAYAPQSSALEPKHLRVGINAVHADMSGLVTLLIEKGVFTELEYFQAMVKSIRDEVELQRKLLADEIGVNPEQIILM